MNMITRKARQLQKKAEETKRDIGFINGALSSNGDGIESVIKINDFLDIKLDKEAAVLALKHQRLILKLKLNDLEEELQEL